jgi:hypothetical protein
MLCAALAGAQLSGAPAVAVTPASGTAAAVTNSSVKVAVRRVTESQYRHIIADTFGPDVKISARFEPEKREDGLFAIGTAQLSLTSSGFEQYFALANSIADQTISGKQKITLPCKPADAAKADDACAHQFIEKIGLQLFRRPLTEAEISVRVKSAALGASQSQDFFTGLKVPLVSLLVAP